ncbi:hypothetical protein LTR93_012276 [Exophiala xenobiotica]|nr:hypothetical protein LTR93_012276 [Exophiala xenobiotica]
MAPPLNVASVREPAMVAEISETVVVPEAVGACVELEALVNRIAVDVVAAFDAPVVVDGALVDETPEVNFVAGELERADVLAGSDPVVAEGQSKVMPVR